MNYDIIGDVHGHSDKLEALLQQMGYQLLRGAWRHPTHIAVFVGDIIDRGPRQMDCINIVRNMLEAGSALAVMGNHELNAVAWVTQSQHHPGEYLRRRHGPKGDSNRHHHKEFLSQIGEDSTLHHDVARWFLQLPLWLDLPELRVAHACWHPKAIAVASARLGSQGLLTESLLEEALWDSGAIADGSTDLSLFDSIELICKGVEIALPQGMSYKDQDGFERNRVRSRWWDPHATTFQKCAILRPDIKQSIPDTPIPDFSKVPLPLDKPIFFGHYWMSGSPEPLGDLCACVDYSAAKKGPLVAYRYQGETPLTSEHFICSDSFNPHSVKTSKP